MTGTAVRVDRLEKQLGRNNVLRGGLCFYAALKLFSREALLVRS